MKQELDRYLSLEASQFLKQNIDLLDTNLEEFYEKARWHLKNSSIGQLTKLFLEVLKIDPLKQMKRVPSFYLGGEFSKHIDPIPNLIPSGVTVIGNEAFKDLSFWDELILPNTIEIIQSSAFKNSSLKKINLPDGLKKIGNAAFMYNEGIEELYIPDSVTYIGINCFAYLRDLKKLYISGNVNDLSESQFDCLLELEDVTFGNTKNKLIEISSKNTLSKFFDSCPKLNFIKCTDGEYYL